MVAAVEYTRIGRIGARDAVRAPVPFRTVNVRDSSDHDPAMQRHHLLPLQLLKLRCFSSMFSQIGRMRVGFDDFRTNGLLLPATDAATIRTGMPLHRGPHRRYNDVVIERVGRIEGSWSRLRLAYPDTARSEAVQRLVLLQSALRKRLLSQRQRFLLNRKDPLGTGFDFAALDAMAESLWKATE